MKTKVILLLALIGISIVFVLQNVTVVEIKFLFWSFQMSRVLLLFLTMIIGLIIGWVLHSVALHQRYSGSGSDFKSGSNN